ncbi:hypothetical protein [Novosphingobium resinovorum]|uniref:hypothetical protein n=1 Tax=Novosphingobium resinovorum TaxID=158500 RepID=UPI002ED54260
MIDVQARGEISTREIRVMTENLHQWKVELLKLKAEIPSVIWPNDATVTLGGLRIDVRFGIPAN